MVNYAIVALDDFADFFGNIGVAVIFDWVVAVGDERSDGKLNGVDEVVFIDTTKNNTTSV